ncbi:hypothetical protein SJI19_16645 [Acerihabitans sp. TG2]|uniref:hypothetical protein n=1 Tax=Acerihabitans sp. TG2 TaxID=3096008 RepID=UPI002B22B9C2|nr:hypothetical protein [Acerihabitans sp. TG2]MEA9392154.1 hypothetical protein [Acerihabitans sp. TG2]
MERKNFTVGLFDFYPTDGHENTAEAFYCGRYVTTVNLTQPDRIRDDEYCALRECFISQVKSVLVRSQYQLIDSNANLLAHFAAHRFVSSDMNLTDESRPESYNLLVDGQLIGPISIQAFARLDALFREQNNGFITSLLPSDTLTRNADKWRSPTRFEIMHVSGMHSLTGITHDNAANIAGITPSSYRKYVASETAKNRATISFATWHFLLIRLGITGAYDDYSA